MYGIGFHMEGRVLVCLCIGFGNLSIGMRCM